jgi:hypothetical protein
MSGLFEHLAADDSDLRLAHRKATAVANKRVQDRFGAFLAAANTPEELSARLSVVRSDIQSVVESACSELGGDPQVIGTSILANLAYGEKDADVSAVRTASNGETQRSVVSRRTKMCPYHREVTDISLAAGDPSAGFNAMAQHAWGAQHCQGEFDGSCNFKPAMTTQKYWDDRAQKAQEKREQLQQQQTDLIEEPQVPDSPEGIDDTPPAEEPTFSLEDGGDIFSPEETAVGATEAERGSLEPMAAKVASPQDPGILEPYPPGSDSQGQWPDDTLADAALRNDDNRQTVDITPDIQGILRWADTVEQTDPGLAARIREALEHQEVQGVNDQRPLLDELDDPSHPRGPSGTPGYTGPVASKQAEALETVDIEKDTHPDFDRTKWRPNALYPNGNLPPVDTEMSGSPHPTEKVDVLEPVVTERSDDFLEGTRSVTESQDVDQDSNFDAAKADSGSWSGNNGANPVSSSLQTNPIRDLMEQGFVPENQIEAAIKEIEDA